MAKAKKLPSGSWRVQVFDHKDVDGKKHYKSFTAPTKREAEFNATQWLNNKDMSVTEKLTLYEAVTRYIDAKRNVLSPSTIRGYEGMQRNYFRNIGTTPIAKLNNTALQIWISNLSKDLSPKTIRNINGLLSPTLAMFAPDFRLKITLPAKIKPDLYCPSDDDVKKLIEYVSGTEMEIAILLAAFGPMRRGEICALTMDDINGTIVHVKNNMVINSDNEWIIKQPKTPESCRRIEYPASVIQRIEAIKGKGYKGRVVEATPNMITSAFEHDVIGAGLPRFRFHDLRHYAASIMHAIGVPDQYILQRGGWSSDNVMKTVYRNVIGIESAKQNKKIIKHFDKISHEISHDTAKSQ